MSWRRVALASGSLAAATPPAWFPGAEWLVLVGLAAFYSLAAGRGAYRSAYLVGCVHMAAFSFSLRHVFWSGYVATALLGAVYYVLTIGWTRALCRRVGGPVAFGLATAGTAWLRANMPEVPYPHGQVGHALWQWPLLLGPVQAGGECLQNALVAALAAALVDLFRAWRVATPTPAAAARMLAGIVLVWAATSLVFLGYESAPGRLGILAVEPGLMPRFQHGPGYAQVLHERLVEPTERACAEQAPALVLWPESTYPAAVLEDGGQVRLAPGPLPLRLPAHTRLLAGTEARSSAGAEYAIGLLLDAAARPLGWYEKRKLVPAGERVPFLGLLPASWREAVLRQITATMGGAPDLAVGRPRALLAAGPSGPAVGTLLCYDNAFPGPAREHVRAGAQVLVVLSNEAWYHGGAELDQLLAMTVFRALETRTPVVRCTVDGLSAHVTRTGRVAAILPAGASRERAQILRAEVELGPGRELPLAWLHDLCLVLVLGSSLVLVPHGVRSWARLPSARSPRPGHKPPEHSA